MRETKISQRRVSHNQQVGNNIDHAHKLWWNDIRIENMVVVAADLGDSFMSSIGDLSWNSDMAAMDHQKPRQQTELAITQRESTKRSPILRPTESSNSASQPYAESHTTVSACAREAQQSTKLPREPACGRQPMRGRHDLIHRSTLRRTSSDPSWTSPRPKESRRTRSWKGRRESFPAPRDGQNPSRIPVARATTATSRTAASRTLPSPFASGCSCSSCTEQVAMVEQEAELVRYAIGLSLQDPLIGGVVGKSSKQPRR